MPFDNILLALDESVRSYDANGYLHVRISHLTKACVNGYRGNEIPDWQDLQLDPYRIYQLFRAPAELAQAASTWNNIQVLDQHVPVTAADAKPERVIGSTGSHATWNAPYIDNSLVFWSEAAIARIESGQQTELSSAYRYVPVMQPGTYQGVNYDGVMTNIRANHVALVEDGRVGSDVVVMDSKLKEIDMKLSPRAAFTAGSTVAYLTPFLAQDHKLPDIAKMFAGVTAKNWSKKKPEIVAAITRATIGKGVFANDAEVHIHEHLDGAGAGAPDDNGDMPTLLEGPDTPQEGGVAETPVTEGTDDDLAAKVQQLLQGQIDDNDLAIILHALKSVKQPDAGAPPANGNAPAAPPKAAAPPKNDDDNGGSADEDCATAGMDNAESIDKPGLAKGPAMDSKPVTKIALDAAIDKAVKDAIAKTTKRLNARDEAKHFVMPWVGHIAVAMDSADEVYKFALEQMGQDDLDSIHPSAYRALLTKTPKPGEQQQASRAAIAMDASGNKAYLERFPNANRLMKH